MPDPCVVRIVDPLSLPFPWPPFFFPLSFSWKFFRARNSFFAAAFQFLARLLLPAPSGFSPLGKEVRLFNNPRFSPPPNWEFSFSVLKLVLSSCIVPQADFLSRALGSTPFPNNSGPLTFTLARKWFLKISWPFDSKCRGSPLARPFGFSLSSIFMKKPWLDRFRTSFPYLNKRSSFRERSVPFLNRCCVDTRNILFFFLPVFQSSHHPPPPPPY